MLGSSEMRRQLLRSSALFSHLGDKEADAILAEARVVNYAEGEHIFAKGDPGNSMMAVRKGRVRRNRPSRRQGAQRRCERGNRLRASRRTASLVVEVIGAAARALHRAACRFVRAAAAHQ